MTPTKARWGESGKCQACGKTPDLHIPANARNPMEGVRCAFGKDGRLLPHIEAWLRPVMFEWLRSKRFQKRRGDDSLVERSELTSIKLDFDRRLATVTAEKAAEISDLHQQWQAHCDHLETQFEQRLSEQSERYRQEISGAEERHKDELIALTQDHETQVSDARKEYEDEIERLSSEMDRLRAENEGLRRDRRQKPSAAPPPVPKKPQGKPVAKTKTRRVTAEEARGLPPSLRHQPLPGVPTHLQVVEGGGQG